MWSISAHRKVRIGDRAFIIQLGRKGNGLFASGYIVSDPFLASHWSGEEKLVPRVYIEFDVLFDPFEHERLTVERLEAEVSRQQDWTPRRSGITIQEQHVPALELLWIRFLIESNINERDVKGSGSFLEGQSYTALQTLYERNPYARQKCIEHYGYSCCVCDFNFQEEYGAIGKQFIHVHHIKPVSMMGQSYYVDPIQDLRPVCPNCHAMLHKKYPPYLIDELKKIMK